MSRFLGLCTTIYCVGDLEKALQWYSQAFETKLYFNESFYVGFNIGGYELGLVPDKEASTEKSDNVLSYWGTEDIDETFKKLLDLGSELHEAPNEVGDGIKVASVKDPWGNVIGIIYNSHFKLGE